MLIIETVLDKLYDVIDNIKQNKLTAGDNITIENDVISATDTTYTAGANIQISENEISATDTTYTAGEGLTLNSSNIMFFTDNYGRYDSTTGETLDLNTVTAFGRYRWFINTEYVTNFPEDAWSTTGESYYYDMYVFKSYETTRNIQILIGQTTLKPTIWMRNMVTASTFGAWVRLDNYPQPETDTSTRITPVGTTVTFSVINSVYDPDSTFTYQWQVSTDDGVSWEDSTSSGCKTNTLSVSATTVRSGYLYRCVISGSSESVSEDAVSSVTTKPARLVVIG